MKTKAQINKVSQRRKRLFPPVTGKAAQKIRGFVESDKTFRLDVGDVESQPEPSKIRCVPTISERKAKTVSAGRRPTTLRQRDAKAYKRTRHKTVSRSAWDDVHEPIA